MYKTVFVLIFIYTLITCVQIQIHAAEFKSGKSISITDSLQDDLYLAAGFINTRIHTPGDLIAAGGNIFMNDSIGQDLLCAGGDVFINSKIGDDIRVAGGTVKVINIVSGDAIVAGGKVFFGNRSQVCGDLIVFAGDVIMNGVVTGDVLIKGGNCTFNGKALGKSKIQSESMTLNGIFEGPASFAAKHINLKEKVRFHQPVEYWQKEDQNNWQTYMLNDSKAVLNPDIKTASWHVPSFGKLLVWTIPAILLWILSAALMILLFILILKKVFNPAGYVLFNQFLRSMGAGVIYLLLTPLAGAILMITVIGIPLGILTFGLYIFSFIIAHALTATVLAYALQERYGHSWSKSRLFFIALGLDAILKILLIIPVLGMLISILGFMTATGALILGGRSLSLKASGQ